MITPLLARLSRTPERRCEDDAWRESGRGLRQFPAISFLLSLPSSGGDAQGKVFRRTFLSLLP